MLSLVKAPVTSSAPKLPADYSVDDFAALADRVQAELRRRQEEFLKQRKALRSVDFTDLLQTPEGKVPFLVKPYFPKGGVVLLHGKKSLGKSPFTWELSHSVALGRPFLGKWSTQQGTVLYLELDTPRSLIIGRLKKIAPPHPAPGAFRFLTMPPFDVLALKEKDVHSRKAIDALLNEQNLHNPALVVVNTLRKCHSLDMNDNGAASQVYTAFQRIFPEATILFVHHDKKTGMNDGTRLSSEEYLGSVFWVNDAQSVLHLVSKDGKKRLLNLEHTYSQVDQLANPLPLRLAEDGTQFSVYDAQAEKQEAIQAAFDATALDGGDQRWKDRVQRASVALTKDHGEGYSESTIRDYLKKAKEGSSGGSDPSEPPSQEPSTGPGTELSTEQL